MQYMLMLLFFCATAFGMNSFNFIISPPIVKLKIHPNTSHKINLTVDNKDEQKLHLMLKICDLEMDQKGNALAIEKEGNPFSCREWLRIDEENLILEARSKRVVPVTIKVPPGVHGGKYAIVLFQTAAQSVVNGDLQFIGQMGTIVMLETYGVKKIQGAIKEFRFHKENGFIHFITIIGNQGNTHFQIKGSVIIKDDQNKIIDRVNLVIGTGTILPDHAREFEGIWKNKKKMRPGKYVAVLQVIIPGQGSVLQEEIELKI